VPAYLGWADYSATTGCAISGRQGNVRNGPANDADVPARGQHEDGSSNLPLSRLLPGPAECLAALQGG
jgi:hypothetical protein